MIAGKINGNMELTHEVAHGGAQDIIAPYVILCPDPCRATARLDVAAGNLVFWHGWPPFSRGLAI
jgi:hypothetical protein